MELDRRQFLKSLGLSTVSLTMIPGVDRGPLRQLYPMLVAAEEIVPGLPYWYTSTCRECPAGCGVLLKVRDGNVVKIEGNPNHPINKGGLCIRGQAALQEVYHVKRIRKPVFQPANGARQEISWDEAIEKIRTQVNRGRLAILTSRLNGGRKRFIQNWIKSLRDASHIEYDPLRRFDDTKANQILFNKNVSTEYYLDKADFIFSVGADFLETFGSTVKLSRKFANARRFSDNKSARFIYAGLVQSLTAANADEFLVINPKSEIVLLLALARWILENGGEHQFKFSGANRLKSGLSKFTVEKAASFSGLTQEKIIEIGKGLIQAQSPLVMCGDAVSAHEQATDGKLAEHILNYVLGSYGNVVSLSRRRKNDLNWTVRDFEDFIQSMEQGQISTLITYDTDPIYSFPDSDRLKEALKKVNLKIALLTTPNSTGDMADFQLPVHHAIETWGIDEPEMGVFSLVQPGMAPVFESRSMEEILASIAPKAVHAKKNEDIVQKEWARIFRRYGVANSFDENWKSLMIQGGFWTEKKIPAVAPSLSPSIYQYLRRFRLPEVQKGRTTFLVQNSYRFFDGRGANKTWLWEIPHSLYHTVWDTPLLMHPDFAKEKNIREGDIVTIQAGEKSIEAPVLIWKKMNPGIVAMEIGAGVEIDENHSVVGTGNPLSLLPWRSEPISGDLVKMISDVKIRLTGKRRKVIRLQSSYNQGEREIVQWISLEEAIKLSEKKAVKKEKHLTQIYPEHKHPNYDWAMVIDLSACIGCGACAAACYAENSVPVVGKHQCERGREMAWLRIERFEDEDGHSGFLPMMCQQCENAPCETVCPVYATIHSEEGLNVQVYNRCVGTRYCSNNCPYKVRRFNYFPAQWPEPMDKMLNPDIYHRPKGVMEKCNFCYQRIRLAKENAKIEGRKVADGEITPACAQSCPTNAIVFGNLNDPNSKVSQLIRDFRAYTVFEELNTKPSVIYLKGIKHG